jgi:hypothetical protein
MRIWQFVAGRSRRAFFRWQANLNFVTFNAHLVGVGLDDWIITPSAITHPKTPSVPRTRYDAIFEMTFGKRSTHVRAKVINRVILAAIVEYCDHFAAHGKRDTAPLLDATHSGDGYEFGHLNLQV